MKEIAKLKRYYHTELNAFQRKLFPATLKKELKEGTDFALLLFSFDEVRSFKRHLFKGLNDYFNSHYVRICHWLHDQGLLTYPLANHPEATRIGLMLYNLAEKKSRTFEELENYRDTLNSHPELETVSFIMFLLKDKSLLEKMDDALILAVLEHPMPQALLNLLKTSSERPTIDDYTRLVNRLLVTDHELQHEHARVTIESSLPLTYPGFISKEQNTEALREQLRPSPGEDLSSQSPSPLLRRSPPVKSAFRFFDKPLVTMHKPASVVPLDFTVSMAPYSNS